MIIKTPFKLFILVILIIFSKTSFSQKKVEYYESAKNDSLRIGTGENDYLPYIQSGYTLMLPEDKVVEGVLIFLEDSGYDKKNNNAKQIYNQASEKNFAVLSVSSEIPFEFYFSETSLISTHNLIQKIFSEYSLPNKNIFFLGSSLIGHRALKYIEFMKKENHDFQLKTEGIVICNFTLD